MGAAKSPTPSSEVNIPGAVPRGFGLRSHAPTAEELATASAIRIQNLQGDLAKETDPTRRANLASAIAVAREKQTSGQQSTDYVSPYQPAPLPPAGLISQGGYRGIISTNDTPYADTPYTPSRRPVDYGSRLPQPRNSRFAGDNLAQRQVQPQKSNPFKIGYGLNRNYGQNWQ